jgi:hypothetical protein
MGRMRMGCIVRTMDGPKGLDIAARMMQSAPYVLVVISVRLCH